MPRPARFPGPVSGTIALSVAMGVLLAGSVLLASRVSEPEERRVAWRGVSLVLPGGFAPAGEQQGVAAVFVDRLRTERELKLYRLWTRPGSQGEAELEAPGEASESTPAGDAHPTPEAVLRLMFSSLMGGLSLPSDVKVDAGVKHRDDGTEVPFAAWVGVMGGDPGAPGPPRRVLVGAMVTTDEEGGYAVLVLHDPAYEQDSLAERVEAVSSLLGRTLETVRFREVARPAEPPEPTQTPVTPLPDTEGGEG